MDGFGGPVHGLSIFYFFYSINRGGQVTASENRSFIVILGLRRLRKMRRLIGVSINSYCSSEGFFSKKQKG